MRQFDVEDPRTKPNLSERVHQVLEHRDHLPSVTAEFPISGGNRGRGQPRRLEQGTFRHPRCLCWFGGSSRRIRPVWESNSEPRSGLAIHRNCFGGSSAGAGGRHQRGRAGRSTTSLSNGCGRRSNTNPSIRETLAPARSCGRPSPITGNPTISTDRTTRLAT